METALLVTIVAAPLLGALVLAVFGSWLARTRSTATVGAVSGAVAGVAAVASLVAAGALIPALQLRHDPTFVLERLPFLAAGWLPASAPILGIRLHLDWLTVPFVITEAAVSLVAIVYAWGYHHVDRRTPYFYALLLLFTAGMAGTTLADDLVLFYTFWELMLVASAGLILVWGEEVAGGPSRMAVTLKYVLFTHFGSLLVLMGLLLVYNAAGAGSFSALRAGVELHPELALGVSTLFIIGFATKMAIVPLHLWLPDAHTIAPMPVTIMLAAAMLSMGTYGILRFPFSFFTIEQLAPLATPMMIAGIISAVYGALMALAEDDVKRIIAYSSVSQMGYILFGLGTFTNAGISGATLHVIFHAIVKALLFMGAGAIIHATGRRRLSHLGGAARALPLVAACLVIGILAISGMPPLCIFDSEWLIFTGGFACGATGAAVASLVGSILTVAYAFWMGGVLLFGNGRALAAEATEDETPPAAAASPAASPAPNGPLGALANAFNGVSSAAALRPVPLAMLAPMVVLALLAILEGLFPAPVFDWVAHELELLFGGGW